MSYYSFKYVNIKAFSGETLFKLFYKIFGRLLTAYWDIKWPDLPCPSATANRFIFLFNILVLIKRLSWLTLILSASNIFDKSDPWRDL